jgi:hypothetical protein
LDAAIGLEWDRGSREHPEGSTIDERTLLSCQSAENSMGFEIMTWAVGFAMTKATQRLAQSLFCEES